MNAFTKTFDGEKFCYYFNGALYRKSAKDYKFGCYAVNNNNGKQYPAALGNDAEATRKSNWKRFHEYCELIVVTIA